MHVRDLAAGEAQVTEHDVLDARREEVAALCDSDLRILVEQVEDHREVVHAERPQRVLVRADDAEVLSVAVDAQDLAELARIDQFLQLQHARVVEQQVARHQHAVTFGRERDELVHLDGAHRRRLLDQDVLAGLERAFRERMVRRDRGGDDDGVEDVVQGVVELAGDRAFG